MNENRGKLESNRLTFNWIYLSQQNAKTILCSDTKNYCKKICELNVKNIFKAAYQTKTLTM